MQTYVLYGYQRKFQGRAGDWIALAVIKGKTQEEAALRLGCKKVSESGRIDPRDRTFSKLVRAIVATKQLRGAKRRQEVRDQRYWLQTNIDGFILKGLATVR